MCIRDRGGAGAGHTALQVEQFQPAVAVLIESEGDGAAVGRQAEVPVSYTHLDVYKRQGHDVTYSGTVTAAMEAVIAGVPGLAFSLDGNDATKEWDYVTAAGYARRIVEKAIAQGLSKDLLLNVNVPCRPAAEIRGIRVTRLGLRVYRDRLDERRDPRGVPYYLSLIHI